MFEKLLLTLQAILLRTQAKKSFIHQKFAKTARKPKISLIKKAVFPSYGLDVQCCRVFIGQVRMDSDDGIVLDQDIFKCS